MANCFRGQTTKRDKVNIGPYMVGPSVFVGHEWHVIVASAAHVTHSGYHFIRFYATIY